MHSLVALNLRISQQMNDLIGIYSGTSGGQGLLFILGVSSELLKSCTPGFRAASDPSQPCVRLATLPVAGCLLQWRFPLSTRRQCFASVY